MDRTALTRYILETYNADEDAPWMKYPGYRVFRRGDNRKWFAVVMDIPREKLGLPGGELLDVVNLKCGPMLAGALRGEPGVFPAYHMNKEHWITIALDGTVPADRIRMLLDVSNDATAPKGRKKSEGREDRPVEAGG